MRKEKTFHCEASQPGSYLVGVFLEFPQKAPVCGFGLVFVKEGP